MTLTKTTIKTKLVRFNSFWVSCFQFVSCLINSIAKSATSTFSAISAHCVLWGEFMTSRTMCLLSMSRSHVVASKNIFSHVSNFEMSWINTHHIFTKMIESKWFWDRSFEMLPRYSVSGLFLILVPKSPVPRTITASSTALPVPTSFSLFHKFHKPFESFFIHINWIPKQITNYNNIIGVIL